MKEESIVSMIDAEAITEARILHDTRTKNNKMTNPVYYEGAKDGYIAGRSKGIESEKAKDDRIKELEDFLQEVTSFNANHHPDYIINKAKQLLNK